MKHWVATILLTFSQGVWATKPELRSTMRETAEVMEDLLIKAHTPEQFAKDKNILLKLNQLEKVFKSNEAHFKMRSADWRLSHKTFVSLVSQAKETHKAKRYEVSRQMVKSLPGLCMSCHTQDNFRALTFKKPLPKEVSLLDRAEFAMATRRPEEAQLALMNLINDKTLVGDELLTAFRRNLQLAIWQNKNWDKIKAELKEQKTAYGSNPEVVRLLSGWIDGAELAAKIFKQAPKSIKDWPELVKKAFGTAEPKIGLIADPAEEVIFLRMGQELHRLFPVSQDADRAWVMYWLAWVERGVSYNYFYSLADGYLKSCMDDYPKSEAAKKCFDEYQSFVEFAYSGSAGTFIPKDVARELEEYKKKVGR